MGRDRRHIIGVVHSRPQSRRVVRVGVQRDGKSHGRRAQRFHTQHRLFVHHRRRTGNGGRSGDSPHHRCQSARNVLQRRVHLPHRLLEAGRDVRLSGGQHGQIGGRRAERFDPGVRKLLPQPRWHPCGWRGWLRHRLADRRLRPADQGERFMAAHGPGDERSARHPSARFADARHRRPVGIAARGRGGFISLEMAASSMA